MINKTMMVRKTKKVENVRRKRNQLIIQSEKEKENPQRIIQTRNDGDPRWKNI